jgi:hypothetical protein
VSHRRAQTLSLAQGLGIATLSPLLLTGFTLLLAWAIAAVLIVAANGR